MISAQISRRAPEELAERYQHVRGRTEELASVLSAEDQVAQSMPDTSPTKWHRAHVTWFFETFVLKPYFDSYQEADADYAFLFNSYYEAAGPRHTRADRGMITRPGIAQVAEYRRHVDHAMGELLAGPVDDEVTDLVVLGLHHEQQHQELLLMDIKHLFSLNPTFPAYHRAASPSLLSPSTPLGWKSYDGGVTEIGHDGDGFSFDNELPRHQALVQPFELADRLVTAGEWIDFINDGGYQNAEHWLSDGWHTVNRLGWDAPEYWHNIDGRWMVFTLAGLTPVDPAQPVCHLSYYEADAYASWAGARLPTEFEWEHAAARAPEPQPDSTDRAVIHPQAAIDPNGELRQLSGEVWQWTSSSYAPYPGFSTAPGAVGEYNGKFMVNTWVLRGGCCATQAGHIRTTYRNFFYPSTRWHFSGLRLARNV